MAFESLESSMVTALYAGLGQSVSYDGRDADTVTIFAIVDNGGEQFGVDVVASEDIATARVKQTDIPTPRRGDCMTMASGTVFVVDGVDRLNNVEWLLTMTERDR